MKITYFLFLVVNGINCNIVTLKNLSDNILDVCVNKILKTRVHQYNIVLYESNLEELSTNFVELLLGKTTLTFFSEDVFRNSLLFQRFTIWDKSTGNLPNLFIIFVKASDVTYVSNIFNISAGYGSFLVLLRDGDDDITSILDNIFKMSNDNGIVNIAVGVSTKEKVNFFNNVPLLTGEICGNATNIQMVHSCINENSDDFSIFPKMVWSDFRNCTIRVAWVEGEPFVIDPNFNESPGLSVSLFNILAEKRNINLRYYEKNLELQQELLGNGSFLKISALLSSGSADVALGHLFMNNTRAVPFDLGPLLHKDHILIVARKPKAFRVYRNILAVFSRKLWYAFLLIFLCTIALFFIFSKFVDINKFNISRIVVDIFRVTIGSGINLLPKMSFIRILFVFYALYSVIMGTIYLSKLSSIFTQPSKDVKLEKVDSLFTYGTGLQFGWHMERLTLMHALFKDSKRAKKQIVSVNRTDFEILKDVALRKINAAMLFQTSLNAHICETKFVDYFPLTSLNITMFTTFYLRKFNPVNEALRFWSEEIVERGFLTKWWKDLIIKNQECTLESDAQPAVIKLKLAHYEEAFIILGIGYIMAILAFIWELFINWTTNQIRWMTTEVIHIPDDLLKERFEW